MVMCLCVLLLLLLQMGILALQPVVNRKLSGSKGRQCQLFRPNPPRMVDIPLIPALICTTAGIFAIFNLENPLDLTDQGLAKSRAQRRAEKLARGELPKSKEGESIESSRLR